MAFNREWDRGKEPWTDGSSWNNPSRNLSIRGREEDYYGEGKRRKFNEGGFQAYDNTQSYNAQSNDESAWDGGSHQVGHQNDYSQDPTQDDRHQRGFHAKKRLVPSEPSAHVIFLGLDPDFNEADLQKYLTNSGCSIETVTIIRERSTGVSKGFGFAQFASTEHARAFVDPIFPFVQIPPPASHGASASAAFYKALETGAPHNGRRVKIDYSQSASPHDKGRTSRQNMNDGTRDIGNAPAPVLLFRGLDPLSGPQAILQAMKSSSGPGKEGDKGMKRIILIKDKVTMASFGFAFVEFIDITSASTVLAATMSAQIHPSGFRISDRPVAASFAHPYSFQPVTDFMYRDDAALPSSLALGGAEGTYVRYWDENSTIAHLEFEVEQVTPPLVAPKEKKEKKKPKSGEADIASKPITAEASILPISDKPVTLNFNKGPATKFPNNLSGPVKAVAPLSLGFSLADETSGQYATDDGADQTTSADDNKVPAVKRVAPLIASQKTAKNINKWNQVQEELKTDAPVAAVVSPAPSSVEPAAPTAKSAPATPAPVETEFEFSDTNAMTCLLCSRQFKTMDQLKRHNKESSLHKKNLEDSSLRDVARQKASGARQAATPKYRDRASERRIMHNQPEIPLPAESENVSKRRADGPPPLPSPPPPPPNPGKDDNNVGNKLLKMMGWTEGTGLGTSADGRVDPVQTAIYAQGAGLGASKGKDIGKYTDSHSGYADKARETARERFGGAS